MYHFVAFDLSKANTGYAEAFINSDFSNIEIHCRSFCPELRTYYGLSNATDTQYFEVNSIINQIKDHLVKSKLKIFATIENPVYGSFATELSYYLTQKSLEVLCDLSIDTLAIVPNTIKKYIGWMYRSIFIDDYPKKKRVYDKYEIEQIYTKLLKTNIFDKYIIKEYPKNNDERDAFFLLLFLIENFNRNYMTLFNSNNVIQYETLSYKPLNQTSFNSLYINTEFFTLKDRKFYPMKYLKRINFL